MPAAVHATKTINTKFLLFHWHARVCLRMIDQPSALPTVVTQAAPDSGRARVEIETALDVFDAAVEQFPKRPAVQFCGASLSYSDLGRKVQQRTALLRRLGVGPGVRLGLLLPNCPAVLIYTFAAYAVGATVVPVDPSLPSQTVMELLESAHVTCLVVSDQAMGIDVSDLLQNRAIERVIVVGYAQFLPMAAAAKLRLSQPFKRARSAVMGNSVVCLERDLLVDDRVEAVATKGLMPRRSAPSDCALLVALAADATIAYSLSHAQLMTNVRQLSAALPQLQSGSEAVLAAVPLSHPFALIAAVHVAIGRAAEIIIPSDMTPQTIAAAVKRNPPSVVASAPPVLAALLASGRLPSGALSRLRFGLSVGAPAPKHLHDAFAALTTAPLLQSYGVQAAFAGATRATDPRLPLGGWGLEQTSIVVRDLADRTRDVPRGERGEICVSGPQFADTKPRPDTAWVPTGDLGLIDTDGRIVLVDRVEDLIVAAGYLIYPGRIEDALLQHPDIVEAAVIGVSDGRRGNAPKAFVVTKRGAAITERDLRLHLAGRISKIEMPADLDFCTQLPHTSLGLVCKHTLRRQEQARQRGSARAL
jgi:long-chain acyl-CoA synthetase